MLRDGQTIDLVAVVPNEAYIWVTGLRYLVTGGLGNYPPSGYTMFLLLADQIIIV